MKNKIQSFFLFLFTLGVCFVVPPSLSFSDDQPFTIDKSGYTNTASIIKDARAHAAAGKILEALAIYEYADQVVDPEKEPILKHKITVEKAHLQDLRQQDLERQQMKTINEMYVKARGYYKEGSLDQAESIFKQILDIDLDQTEAQHYIDTLIPQQLKDKARRDQLKEERQNKEDARQAKNEKLRAERQAKVDAVLQKRAQVRSKRDHQNAQQQALAAWTKQKRNMAPLPAAGPDETKVMVYSIKFTGNSIFDDATLQAIVAPQVNKELTLHQLKALAGHVAQYYHNVGYFLAQVVIPQQDINAQNGVVNFTILEGLLGKITVAGNKRFSQERIRQALSDVYLGDPLRKQNLQRALLVLNSDSGIKTSSVLQPGQEVGTTDVNVNVTEANRIKGSLTVDNTGVASTGRYHISPELIFPNITGRGDLLDFKWINAMDAKDAYYYGLNYMTPVGSRGFQLKGEYIKSTFAVGQQYAALGIKSHTTIYGMGGYYPYILTPHLTMSLESWFEVKDFDQTFFSSAYKLIDDRIRKIRIEPLNFDEQDLTGRTLGSVGIHQGMGEDFKGMTNDSLLSSRSYAKADDNFTKFVTSLSRVQAFNDRLSLVGRISGQYSHAPLVAGEEWSIGGMDSVHGFEAGQYLGDEGLTANLESSYTLLSTLKTKYSLLFFVDHGNVWLIDPTIAQRERYGISGSGVGLDVDIYDVDARLDWGYPIGPTDGGGSTIYFQIKYSF